MSLEGDRNTGFRAAYAQLAHVPVDGETPDPASYPQVSVVQTGYQPDPARQHPVPDLDHLRSRGPDVVDLQCPAPGRRRSSEPDRDPPSEVRPAGREARIGAPGRVHAVNKDRIQPSVRTEHLQPADRAVRPVYPVQTVRQRADHHGLVEAPTKNR